MSLKNKDFKQIFWQFFRYSIVGFLTFSTYALINFILIKKMGNTAEFSIIFANIGGGTTNYLLNKRFTFKNNCENVPAQIATFIFFNIFIYLLIARLILFLIHGKNEIIKDDFYSTIAVAVIMMPINFLMAKLITFNKKVIK